MTINPNVQRDVAELCHELCTENPCSSVVLYGSHARGDSNHNSDIDVLLVGERSHPRDRKGSLCVSHYSEKTIEELATQGSLFALHLLREAVVFADPELRFGRAISRYRAPASYLRFREDLICLAKALDVDEFEYTRCPAWLNRVGLFIMRSACYVEMAERGEPQFSIRAIAAIQNNKQLWQCYRRKYQQEVTFSQFVILRSLLQEKLGTEIRNPNESLVSYLMANVEKSELIRGFSRRLAELSHEKDVSTLISDYALRCNSSRAATQD